MRSRRAVVIGIAVASALIAGGIAFVVLSGRDAGDDAARRSAERYLRVLSDTTQDPADLTDLVSVGRPEQVEDAGILLAGARERISDTSLGDPTDIPDARTSSDLVFDSFKRFEVDFRLAGQHHRGSVTLGLPRTGSESSASDWLVVTPLSGSVDWNAAAIGSARPDIEVGGVEVTDHGRTDDTRPFALLHPAVYDVRATLGPWFTSDPADLVVVPSEEPTPLPDLDLQPTAEGTSEIAQQTLAAFDACERGTAYCPVADLVYPSGSTTLEDGWWLGLARKPTITVDELAVELTDGEFRYTSPSGIRRVRFEGEATVTVDANGRPDVAVPMEIRRLP